MAAVTGKVKTRSSRRAGPGAQASRHLLRWPSRNYFAEIEPHPAEEHPVLARLNRAPALRRLRTRAHGLLNRLHARARSEDVLGFEAARNDLDAARVEVAYNLGFESGAVEGRADGLRRGSGLSREADEEALLFELRALLSRATASRERIQALLLEISWSLALEIPRPNTPATQPSSDQPAARVRPARPALRGKHARRRS